METYLAAAVDKRIRAAVPCIGVQSFRWAVEHDAWQSRVGTFQAAMNGAAKDSEVAQVDAAFVRSHFDGMEVRPDDGSNAWSELYERTLRGPVRDQR